MILTTNEVAEQLKKYNRDYEGRRTWSQLYGSIDLSAQQALEQTQYDYSSAIGEAYASAYKQQSAIENSPLGQGFKKEAIADLDFSLNEAFNTYRQNYLSQKQQIEQSASEAKEGVTDTLIEQAENIKNYASMPYKYLTDLYNRAYGNEDYEKDDYEKDDYEKDEKLFKLFEQNNNWKKYLVDVKNENGEVTGKRLMTKEELYDTLYDSSRNLTIKGADFYDQMLNELGGLYGSNYDFNTWLANEDSDLYEWSHTYNPYDYAPDAYGNSSNISSVKTMFGLASDDEKYTFVERFAGMNEGELNEMFKRFTNSVTDLTNRANESKAGNSKTIISDVNNAISEVSSFAENLGILDDIEKELGYTFKDIKSAVDIAYSKSESGVTWDDVFIVLGQMGAGAAAAGASGAIVTGKLAGMAGGPGAAAMGIVAGGGVGSIAGGVVGLITGIITAASNVSSRDANANKLARESVKYYESLVMAMTNYAQQKRRQAEIDFYRHT